MKIAESFPNGQKTLWVKACFPGASKGVIVWEWVNMCIHFFPISERYERVWVTELFSQEDVILYCIRQMGEKTWNGTSNWKNCITKGKVLCNKRADLHDKAALHQKLFLLCQVCCNLITVNPFYLFPLTVYQMTKFWTGLNSKYLQTTQKLIFMPLYRKIGGILFYRCLSVRPSVCLSACTNLTWKRFPITPKLIYLQDT